MDTASNQKLFILKRVYFILKCEQIKLIKDSLKPKEIVRKHKIIRTRFKVSKKTEDSKIFSETVWPYFANWMP